MAGITSPVTRRRIVLVTGVKTAAVAANDLLASVVYPFPAGRISAVVASAAGAGGTSGSDILDVQKNGTTMFTTAANMPTLGYASTGAFANKLPDVLNCVASDVITIKVTTAAGTGHTGVTATVVIEVM